MVFAAMAEVEADSKDKHNFRIEIAGMPLLDGCVIFINDNDTFPSIMLMKQ